MCAEQRLCVSIASIKRAELGKNILFRTARNIANFFDVALDGLIAGNDESFELADRVGPQDSQISIDSRRELVLLVADLVLPENNLLSGSIDQWQAYYDSLQSEFGSAMFSLSETRFAVVFGVQVLMGFEHFQALQLARRLLQHFGDDSSGQLSVHSFISYQRLPFAQFDADKSEQKPIVAAKVAELNLENTGDRKSSSIMVTGNIKHALDNKVSSIEIPTAAGVPALWRIDQALINQGQSVAFIGRELQRLQFEAAVESVFAFDEMQVIYISGMAGIGKTRLQEEFFDYASNLGIECYRSHVLDFGLEQAQTAIPKLIRSILKLSADEVNLSYQQLNTRFGSAVCDEADLIFLYSWLNWPLSGKALSIFNTMTHEVRSAGLHRVVEELIRKLTQKSPLLLCIEDMHWANDDLLDSILVFAEALKESKVILLFTSRKENDPMQKKWLSSWVNFPLLVMNLSPLRPAEAGQFANSFTDVDEAYKQLCVERAEGNPLFLEQLLRNHAFDPERLPRSLQTLVSARLESLSPQSQTMARAAAVLGQWFTTAALNFILESKAVEIKPLIDFYLVKASGDRYQFVHALVQQGIYQSITDKALADIHRRCALWFEAIDVALQARHLNRARADDTFAAFLSAIDIKMEQQNFDEANNLVEEAFKIDYMKVDLYLLWIRKAEIMNALGRTKQAVEGFQKSLKNTQNKAQKFAPLVGLASCLDTLDLYDDALVALKEAEQCVSENDRNQQRSQIHYLRGNFFFPRGRVDDCRAEHEKALEYARLANDAEAEAKALGGLGDAAYAQGRMITGFDYFKQCLKLCTEHGFGKVEAANLFMRATTRIYLNETEAALQDALESAELASSVGHKRAEIVSRLTATWVLISMQAFDAANEQCQLGLNIAHNIGAHRFEPFLAESLACVHYECGDFAMALSIISEAWSEVEKQGVEEFIGPWVASSYALICNDDKQARALLKKGSELLQQGCIGHNYFRFYQNAIEFCLLRQDWQGLPQYVEAFELYTSNNPTPWSGFYINRARLIAKVWTEDLLEDLTGQLRELEKQAEQSGLTQSIGLIRQAMGHHQSTSISKRAD